MSVLSSDRGRALPSMLMALAFAASCSSASQAEVRTAPVTDGPATTAASTAATAGASQGGPAPVATGPALQVAGGSQNTGADPSRPDGALVAGGSSGGSSGGSGGGVCGFVKPAPPVRRGGNLTVESPPRAPQRTIGSRMRSSIEGALSASASRTWVGIDVPSFVQIASGTLELFFLDRVHLATSQGADVAPDGFFAFYRDPYDGSSCRLSGGTQTDNCAYGVALYHCSGKLQWVFTLNQFMSRAVGLEVQDARYDGGVLYFNEACESYSKESGGQCSSLVAVDPIAKSVLWRTQPLVSNNAFVVADRYLVTGYGFTAEPDFLYVIRRSDGKVMQRLSVTTAHDEMRLEERDKLHVKLYDGTILKYTLKGFDGDAPKLVRVPVDPLNTRR